MAENFSSAQVLGEPSEIVLTDTSTGLDAAVVTRRVTLTDNAGNIYVEEGTTTIYEIWANYPGTTTITLDVLTQDRALNITVEWMNVSGTALYTKTVLTLFYMYARTYRIFLIKSQSSRLTLINLANFYYNAFRLHCSIKEAIVSVEDIADIASAQAALNRAKKLIDNPANFF